MESAFQAVHNALPKLENSVIEFLAKWLVALLAPARHVLGLHPLTAQSPFDRTESYVRVIDGQIRCITPDFKPKYLHVAWNVQYVVVFVPAWMIPLCTTAFTVKVSKARTPEA